MADEESRRGVTEMADADKQLEPKASENLVDSVEISEKIEEKQPEPSSEPTEEKDERAIQLAKAREELNKAREESARARDEVEQAKKELLAAKIQSDDTQIVNNPEPPTENEPEIVTQVQKEPETVIEAKTDPEAVIEAKKDPEVVIEAKDPEEAKKESEIVTEVEKEPEIVQSPADQKVPNQENESPPDPELPIQQVELVPDESKPEKDTPVQNPEPEIEKSDPIPKETPSETEAPPEIEKSEEESKEEASEDEDYESDEDVVVEGEREEGDGEESDDAPAKPVDDDEDRRNPQYIPKRGGFYEHDDRTREEGGEAVPVEEPEVEQKVKKGLRSEVVDRWGHDMFDENQQRPKSNQELVSLYGYDIRQEEGAPRARRRRRYGRGPNKYDRTWEDEEAYSRPRGGVSGRGGGRGRGRETSEEFPALPDQVQKPDQPQRPDNWREGAGPRGGKPSAISFRRGGGGRTFEERNKNKKLEQESGAPVEQPKERKPSSGSAGSGRIPSARGSGTSPRGRGGRGGHSKEEGSRNPAEESRGRGRSERFEDHSNQAVTGRNQEAKSKRYSSQRQRMTTPPPAGIIQPAYPASSAYYASYNDSPPPTFVPPAPLIPLAAQGAPPAYMAPPMYPAAPGPPAPYTGPYQPYPPGPATIGSPTQDLYAGGIMYYDPGRQPMRHGVPPVRRAKAAIPIVAPEADTYLMTGRRPE